MATPRQVGQAFVEILADWTRFRRTAEKELNDELKHVGRRADFTELIEAAAEAGEDAGQEFTDEFGDAVLRGGRKHGKLLARTMKNAIDDALDGVRNTSSQVSEFFGGLLSSVGKGFTGLLAQVASLIQKGPELAAKLAALVTVGPPLVLGLIGIVAQLSTLAGLVGVLPGMIATLVTAFVPLVIAFQGFGDALEAIMDGDPDKIREALKGLSPAARAVAKEFQKLVPQFRELRQLVQQAFFQEVTGALTRLMRALGPALAGGLANVATAMGELLDAFSRRLATPAVADQIARIFEATGRIITALGAGGMRLMEGFLAVVVASLPVVEKLLGLFGQLLTTVGDKLIAAVESGEFQRWIDEALATGAELVKTFQLLWEFVTLLFGLTREEGKKFLEDLNAGLATLNSYLKDPTIREALKGLLQMFSLILGQVLAIGLAFTSISLFIGFVIAKVRELLGWLDRLVGKSKILGVIRSFVVSPVLPALLAEGDVVRRPTLAMIGEAGPEAVVPLNNPKRAREVMSRAGLLNMGFGGGGGAPTVQVFLGTREITDILDVRVVRALGAESRALANGPRAA